MERKKVSREKKQISKVTVFKISKLRLYTNFSIINTVFVMFSNDHLLLYFCIYLFLLKKIN